MATPHDTPATAYGAWLDWQPLAATTRRVYRTQVQHFVAFVLDHDALSRDPFHDPTARDVVVADYKRYLTTVAGAKPRSINLALAAIDHFYRFLTMGPPNVRREPLPHQAPRALSPPEQQRLLQAIAATRSIRDRAVATLLLYTGLRAGECAALNLDDVRISTRRGLVIVRSGKGDRYREIPLNAAVRQAITAWQYERAQRFPTSQDPALFLTRQGHRLGVRAINLLLHQLGRVAQVQLSSHTLRHTCLTNLVRQGTDLVLVADIAGHRRLDTTRLYTLPTHQDREAAMESLIPERDRLR